MPQTSTWCLGSASETTSIASETAKTPPVTVKLSTLRRVCVRKNVKIRMPTSPDKMITEITYWILNSLNFSDKKTNT